MNIGFNNNFNVDYVCPGFCSMCFAEVANFSGSHEVAEGVYRPRVTGLKSNYRKVDVYLSNGSQMTVSLCQDCEKLTPENLPRLMENEIKGWEKEVEDFKLHSDENVKWLAKAREFTIIDVPKMRWDEATREALSGTGK